MTLSTPGSLWYSAQLIGFDAVPDSTKIVGHFEVWDANSGLHNGLAVDGVTVQQYLDIEIDIANPPTDLQSFIRSALQKLYIAECGGFAQGAELALQNGTVFQ